MNVIKKLDKATKAYDIFVSTGEGAGNERLIGTATHAKAGFELTLNSNGRELGLENGKTYERMNTSKAGEGLLTIVAQQIEKNGPKLVKAA